MQNIVELIEYMNYSNAAEKLHISQPSLKIELNEIVVHGTNEITIGVMESIMHLLPKMMSHLVDILCRERVNKSLKSYKTHLILTNQLMAKENLETICLYEEYGWFRFNL